MEQRLIPPPFAVDHGNIVIQIEGPDGRYTLLREVAVVLDWELMADMLRTLVQRP